MVRRAAALVLLCAGAAGVYWMLTREVAGPEPGISLALARDRASRINGLRYTLNLKIPSASNEAVTGTLTASFVLTDASRPLAFDFGQPAHRLHRVTANGDTMTARAENGHVVVPPRHLAQGQNTIDFQFTAGDESLNRGEDFLYSLFVPARASLAFPCFDQPDLKARWTLTLDVPDGWVTVSNGREAGRTTAGNRAHVLFDETAPLSTYLFAFAAGRFSMEAAERDGRVYRMFHRENDAEKVARNRDAIFDLHARALAWLESYVAIPYPFGKFDIVLIPSFQFAGMEHPGAMYYNASALLLDQSATQNQMLARANTISHETAHMWFGDLVTMKWFNDVWMKEVFASLMAAKIVNPSFPAVNHDLRFLLQHYPSAYEVDRTDGSNPIRQDLDNLGEAGSLYGAIIYSKAPIVMRQLELAVGPDAFRDGLREYLNAHAFGNADWPDLIEVLDRRTPADLQAWSKAWVDQAGRPTIKTDLRIASGTIESLRFEEMDPRGRSIVWPERLQVLVGSGRRADAFDVTLGSASTEIGALAGRPAPTWVLPVGRGLGYGLFELDPASVEFLAGNVHTLADPLTRGSARVALWELMLENRIAPSRVFDALLVALPRESDELNLQHILDQIRTLFWRFTPADDRSAAATRLEPILRSGLDRATSTSAKAAWFAALRSVATSTPTVGWLEALWRRQATVRGLPLAEPDEADLAADLAVRDVPSAEEVLQLQLQRFTNADRRARFAFIMPALSRDASVRDQFFTSLADVNNRKHEAWVLDAVRYLHHPLRAAVSRKHVRAALGLVEEIQQTGDIFFPKRWADATLGGYQSVQTAAEVRAFIDGLPPSYPQRLRWVLLSAADPLFRAAKFQQ